MGGRGGGKGKGGGGGGGAGGKITAAQHNVSVTKAKITKETQRQMFLRDEKTKMSPGEYKKKYGAELRGTNTTLVDLKYTLRRREGILAKLKGG